MINEFCIESEWGNSYVRAVKDYVTRESTLLSFTKGEYIRLTHKDTTLDKGKAKIIKTGIKIRFKTVETFGKGEVKNSCDISRG